MIHALRFVERTLNDGRVVKILQTLRMEKTSQYGDSIIMREVWEDVPLIKE